MFSSHNSRSSSAYKRISVETSMHTVDKHQIVSLLFEGLLESLGEARGALARKEIANKCNAVSKALRILQEGLTSGLDKVDGGELASNLESLYDYCANRLILANARNDDAIFQEVQRLIEPVAQAWKGMIQTPATPQASITIDMDVAPRSQVNKRISAYTNLSFMGA